MSPAASFDPTLDGAPPSARLLRSLGLLGLSGASLALAGQFISMRAILPKFISTNDLPKSDRTLLLVTIAIGALVPQLVVGVVLLFRRARAIPAIECCSRLFAPAIVAATLPPLFCLPPWQAAPLDFLALLSVVVVLTGVTGATALTAAFEVGRRASARTRALFRPLRFLAGVFERRGVAFGVVVLSGLLYAGYTAYLTIVNLRRSLMGSYDMGLVANQMFNSLHGHPFRNTVVYGPKGGNLLAVHAEVVHLLFLPFYAMKPGPEILLVIQAAMVGLAVIPLFLYAGTVISRRGALVVSVLYLLYAPLHGAQFHDFHWLTIAPFFVFSLFYALAADRRWLVLGSVIVLLALEEDVAPGIAAVGLFLLVTRTKPRLGTALVASGMAWFVLAEFVVMPLAGAPRGLEVSGGLVPPGETGYWAIVRTIITNPSFLFTTLLAEKKLVYVLHLFAPLAFLPARRALFIPLVAPGFLFAVLSVDHDAATSISNQNTIHWIPFLFVGSVLALRAIDTEAGRPAAVAALSAAALGVVAHSLVFGVLFAPDTFRVGQAKVTLRMTAKEALQYRGLQELVDRIPRDASVLATDIEIPFIATRLDVFSAARFDADASFVLIHADHFTFDAKKNVGNLLSRYPFGLVEEKGRAFLFKRGERSVRTAAALQSLGIAPTTAVPSG